MADDRNAQALRALLNGPLPAKEISAAVGWAPRSAGPKLHALERAGLVRKREELGEDNTPRVLWALTRKGGEIVGPRQLGGPPAALAAEPQAAALDGPRPQRGPITIGPSQIGKTKAAVEEVTEAIEAVKPTPSVARTEADEGPWPSLRAREGGVDPPVSASLNLSGWLFVLRAAHSGASSGSVLTRERVDAELRRLEAQLDLYWAEGLYETADGTTVTPEKLAYLKHQL